MNTALPALNCEALNTIAQELRDKKHYDAALATIDRALVIHPDNWALLTTKGKVLYSMRRLEEGFKVLSYAIEEAPDAAVAYHARALVLLDLGRCEEALLDFDKALRLEPSQTGTRWDMCLTRLLKGDWRRGFEDYEQRLVFLRDRYPQFAMPFWRGEDLDGRHIFVQCEQGHGDNFMFARYIPWLAEQGAEVTLAMGKHLVPVFHNYPGVTTLLTDGKRIPHCDFGAYMVTLPGIYKTTLVNVPSDPGHFRRLGLRAGFELPWPAEGTRKIGIVWAGSSGHAHDHLRSIKLEDMLPLSSRVDCTIYSFQVGQRQADIALANAEHLICDLSAKLTDWVQTAAALCQMDLVITVDTAVCHMAGACGVPVWTLIGESPDFRWVRKRLDTPWYPSMRLFRREHGEQWPVVIQQVQDALDKHLSVGISPPARSVHQAPREPDFQIAT